MEHIPQPTGDDASCNCLRRKPAKTKSKSKQKQTKKKEKTTTKGNQVSNIFVL